LNAWRRRPGASTEQDNECKRNHSAFHGIALYKIACSLGTIFSAKFFLHVSQWSWPDACMVADKSQGARGA
jgi:hypothetical protein